MSASTGHGPDRHHPHPCSLARSPGTPAGNGVLVNGSKGDEVQAMQQKLSDLGYLGKDGKPLVADGDFGPGTVEAVKQFQRDHHLTVDGKAGGATLGALEVATQQRAQAAEPTMATLATPTTRVTSRSWKSWKHWKNSGARAACRRCSMTAASSRTPQARWLTSQSWPA